MANERKTDSKEEVIKDLPKKDKPLSDETLGGVAGGMANLGGIAGGISKPSETTNVNFEAQTDGKWDPHG